jgi:hypothetical protein
LNDVQKHIIFHAGTIKTASTYIQKFLFECKDQLSVFDIDYILLSPPRLDLPRYANADFIIDNNFDVQHVKDMIRTSSCRHIIISEEGLMGRRKSISSEAFAACKRTAIIYIRPPVDLVAAWAAENSNPYNFDYIRIAQGLDGEGQGVLAVSEVNPTAMGARSGIGYCCFTYAAIIDGFLNAVEADEELEFIIRSYGHHEFLNGNILVDFFDSVGLGDKLDDGLLSIIQNYDTRPFNESSSRKYCDVSAKTARLIQKFAMEEIFGEALVDFVFDRCASGDDRTVIETLSDTEMETIVGSLQTSYQRLSSKGYKSAVGFESMLPAIHGNGRRSYQPVDDDEVKHAVIEFLEDGGRILPDGTELAISRTEPLYKDVGMKSPTSTGARKKLRELGHTKVGFDLEKEKADTPDIMDDGFWDIAAAVWDYTELPILALHSLYCAARYLVARRIEGAFVECGVYLGGSVMAVELILARHEGTLRHVYALDTFSGSVRRNAEFDIHQQTRSATGVPQAGLDYSEGAIANMRSVGYPGLRIVKGDVLQTIPTLEVDRIALLLLDTDTYETTKFELESLYDRVVRGGVVIVDDYGYTVGCRKAVDDFLATRTPVLLKRINKNVRSWIKP